MHVTESLVCVFCLSIANSRLPRDMPTWYYNELALLCMAMEHHELALQKRHSGTVEKTCLVIEFFGKSVVVAVVQTLDAAIELCLFRLQIHPYRGFGFFHVLVKLGFGPPRRRIHKPLPRDRLAQENLPLVKRNNLSFFMDISHLDETLAATPATWPVPHMSLASDIPATSDEHMSVTLVEI